MIVKTTNGVYAMIASFVTLMFLILEANEVMATPNPIPGVGYYAEKCYDFIVVGAGAAGCVVARRLSEKYRVLLLEWGGEPDPILNIPALYQNFVNDHNEFVHFYRTVPQKSAGLISNGILTFMSGKVLGGSAEVGAMTFNRGNPNDYDNWANITGDSSWRYVEMLKYFKRIEDYHGGWPFGIFHGRGGPIPVARQKYAPGLDTWLEAGGSLGFPNADPNALQTASFIPLETNKRHGERVSSYHGYVKPFLGRSRNLKVIPNAKVNKIIFEGYKAVGVEYITKDGEKVVACLSKEVILTAGAISSPVILMKSGIGPKQELNDAGIAPVKHLPVGRNLLDHPVLSISILLKKNKIQVFDPKRDLNPRTFREYNDTGDGPYSCANGRTAQAFLVSSVRAQEQVPNSLWPDLHLLLVQTPSKIIGGKDNETGSSDGNDISILTRLMLARPKSREGTITLDKTNIDADPLIDFKYFSHPDDIEAMIDGFQQVLNLFENTTAYQEQGVHYPADPVDVCKDFAVKSREYIMCYIKYFSNPGVNPAGTCRMGRGVGDPDAVVDTKLRVIGIENVRVADCSIMPVLTNAYTQVPAMVIGEKAAADILEHWRANAYAQVY